MKPEIKQHQPPMHDKHWTSKGGLLPPSVHSSAIWQFAIMAHQALEKIPTQKTLEGTKDIDVSLKDLAHSTLAMYNMPSIEDGGLGILFQPQMITLLKREAYRCGLPWDNRLDAWFASGGKSYDQLTRDPDTLMSD